MSRARQPVLATLAALAWLPAAAAAQHSHGVILHVSDRWKECAIRLDPSLTQAAWRQFVEEAGLVVYFRPLTDARPMGRGNWEVSLLSANTRIDDSDPAWNDTFVHPDADHWLFEGSGLVFPGLTARVGVSNRIDLGAYFTKNLNANYGVAGAQVQYAFISDPDSPWGLAGRLSLMSLFGPEDLNHGAVGLDVLASRRVVARGILEVTPYVGASSYVSAARERSGAVALDAEVVAGNQAMAGVVVQVAMVRLAAEINSSRVNTRSLKLGVAF